MNPKYTREIVEDVQRVKEVYSLNELDTPPENQFDRLTKMASVVCDAPIALISLIDDQRQWFKSKIGIDEDEVDVENTICQYTITGKGLFEIENAKKNEIVANKPFVTEKKGIRFYAGLPIKTKNGFNIGTVCVADSKPKKLSEEQKEVLKLIAEQATGLLERKKENESLKNELSQILNAKLNKTTIKLSQVETDYELLYKEISNSGVLIELDAKGDILRVNDYFQNLTGISCDSIVGESYQVLINEKTSSKEDLFKEALHQNERKTGKIQLTNTSGEEIWLRTSLNPLSNSKGEVRGLLLVAQDITAEIKSQQYLLESKKTAERTNAQKDKFIANMSHEIRTPLNAILGFTELLNHVDNIEQGKEYLKPIKNAGDKLLFIVNDILDLSKIEAGVFQIDQRPFELIKTIEKVFSILHLNAHRKKLDFSFQIDENVPDSLFGDKNRLAQILLNLLNNALKFTDNGFVKLSVSLNGTLDHELTDQVNIQFKVSDTGIGIAKDKLDMIFERFSQEDSQTSVNYGGTGLGLNITKLLVEKQGGSIEVLSEKNRGSDFIFSIPFKLANSSELELEAESSPVHDTQKANVLLCEDNVLNQKLIEAIFSRTNYQLDIVSDGNEAIDILKNKQFDIVLMDIQMPNKNGYKVVEEVRKDLKLDVLIIGISAHSMIKEKRKCLRIGMNDYLSKPFTRKELLNKMHYWLAKDDDCLKELGIQWDKNTIGHISTNRLKELSSENPGIQKKIINLFIKESENDKSAILEFIKKENVTEMNDILHKLKSSFDLVGASTVIIDFFEDSIDRNKSNLKDVANCLLKQLDMIVLNLKNVDLT